MISITAPVVILLFLSAFCVAEDDEFAMENGVFVLTDSTFDKFIEQYPTALIEFYAPWCGHCKQLAPEYEAAAKALAATTDLKVALAKVDATVETELGKKYDVSGYPTLKWWKDGEGPNDYEGPRDGDGIEQWIREKTDPNYKPPPEEVVTLTKDNFADIALREAIILVEFYAPWCGHCKQLAPEFEKAAKKLKKNDPPILLAKVDATIETELAKEYSVTGYPTLILFRQGRKFDYSGPREAQGIVEHMIEQSKPAARDLKSAKEVKKFMSDDDVTILAFFGGDNEKFFEMFKEASEGSRMDFKKMAYVSDVKVVKELKAEPNTIRLYQPERFWSKFEPKFRQFDDVSASREDIIAFFQEKAEPLVGHRTQENQGKRFPKRPLIVVYYTVDFSHAHRDGTQYWRQKVLSVADKFKDLYHFAIADEKEFSKELEDVGLGESGSDVNVICFGKDGKRYPLRLDDDDDDFSTDVLTEFMKSLNKGRVRPHIKSQPAPKQGKSAVKVVVASNFDKVVMDESKDVLIEFYAPWCGHCKSLEPEYLKMATKLASDKSLVIAKMDATANDITNEKYSSEGFPTIYFAPSGRKEDPIKYTGDRSVDGMIKFMKDNSIVSFKNKEEL